MDAKTSLERIAYADLLAVSCATATFVCGAVGTALAFLPLLACFHPSRHLVRLAPMLALARLCAGAACWLVLKSPHDEDTVPTV